MTNVCPCCRTWKQPGRQLQSSQTQTKRAWRQGLAHLPLRLHLGPAWLSCLFHCRASLRCMMACCSVQWCHCLCTWSKWQWNMSGLCMLCPHCRGFPELPCCCKLSCLYHLTVPFAKTPKGMAAFHMLVQPCRDDAWANTVCVLVAQIKQDCLHRRNSSRQAAGHCQMRCCPQKLKD